MFIINHIVHIKSLGTVLGALQDKSQIPDAGQRPTLPAGLSKDSSLRPAMVTLSCTVQPLGPWPRCLYDKIIISGAPCNRMRLTDSLW